MESRWNVREHIKTVVCEKYEGGKNARAKSNRYFQWNGSDVVDGHNSGHFIDRIKNYWVRRKIRRFCIYHFLYYFAVAFAHSAYNVIRNAMCACIRRSDRINIIHFARMNLIFCDVFWHTWLPCLSIKYLNTPEKRKWKRKKRETIRLMGKMPVGYGDRLIHQYDNGISKSSSNIFRI